MAIINFSVKVTYMMNINDEDYDDYFLGLTPKEYEQETKNILII